MPSRRTTGARSRSAAIGRGAALAAAVLLIAGCGDAGPSETAAAAPSATAAPSRAAPTVASSPAPTPTPAPVVHAIPAGPAGATFEVPASDPLAAGWRVVVPAGALASDVDLTVTALPPEGSAAAAAEAEPAFLPAFGDAVLAAMPDDAVSPIFGPVRALLGATQVGPTLRMGPPGTDFATPVEVVVPATAIAGAGDAVYVAVVRSEDGTMDAVATERRSDGLHVPVPHFSGVKVWQVLRRIVTDPGTKVDRKLVLAARDRLAAAPLADAERAILSATACDGAGTVTVDATKLPTSLTRVLYYLGTDSGAIAQGRDGDDVVLAMNKYLQARLAEREKVTKRGDPARTHFVTMEDLYREALRQTDGDAFQALLAVHGVLRDNRRQDPKVPNPWLEAIEVLRGDGGDEDGARYHFVGAAIYAFLYAHQKDAQKLSVLNLPPEDVVRLEEAWVSGDIVSDVTEYAVDLEGIAFGRRLYDHFRAVAQGEASPLAAQVCTTMEGSVDLASMATTAQDRDLIARIVTENTAWLTFEPVADDPDVQARVKGEIVVSLLMPPDLLYAIHSSIGDKVFGIKPPPMPDTWLDCTATMTVRIALTGTQARAGKHQVTGRADAETHGSIGSGCEDTGSDLKLGEAPPQKGLRWTATGSPTSMKGKVTDYGDGGTLVFTVKAVMPAW